MLRSGCGQCWLLLRPLSLACWCLHPVSLCDVPLSISFFLIRTQSGLRSNPVTSFYLHHCLKDLHLQIQSHSEVLGGYTST